MRASLRALWGLSFAVWSALLYAFATRVLRGLGVRPSSSPGRAHADLETHLQAAAVFMLVVAIATALTAAVLSVSSSPKKFVPASIRAGLASCLIGGAFIAVGFPERPWLAAGGACAAAATWHALMGRAIFARPAHSFAATGNATGLR